MVLRGAPLGTGDVPNRDLVPLLRRHSPLGDALALNIETAVERVTVPVFRDGFGDRLGGLTADDVLALLSRLDLDHPYTEEQLALPEERGATPAEILAAEEAQVADSAAWAREHIV
jgi:hypothetical protein